MYDPVRDEVYLVPIDEAATGKMGIRFVKPANGQRTGINWYEEFLLDERLPALRD